MHAFKQFVGTFANPLLLAVCAGLLALAIRRRWPRTSRTTFAIALAIAYLGALPPVGELLLRPLEKDWSAYSVTSMGDAPRWIVVLGSGYNPRDGIPVTSALDNDGIKRVAEGLRLTHQLPNARLIVSGGAAPPGAAPAEGYALMAREFGFDAHALVVLNQALDTSAEASAIAAVVKQDPFLLVTSAAHMTRAMKIMQRNGLHPVAAPTAYLTSDHVGVSLMGLIPSSSGLFKSEHALHEYLGLLAMELGGE